MREIVDQFFPTEIARLISSIDISAKVVIVGWLVEICGTGRGRTWEVALATIDGESSFEDRLAKRDCKALHDYDQLMPQYHL